MFDGSVLPRRRVSLARSPLVVNKDREKSIKIFNSVKLISSHLKGFIQRKRWKLELEQKFEIIESHLLQLDYLNSEKYAGNVWELVRTSYFARKNDLKPLLHLSRLVDSQQISKDFCRIKFLKLFLKNFRTVHFKNNHKYLFYIINILSISEKLYNEESTELLAYAASVAISKNLQGLLDKVSRAIKLYSQFLDPLRFAPVFWGTNLFSQDDLSDKNLVEIFKHLPIISTSPFNSLKIHTHPPLCRGILIENSNLFLNISENPDLAKTVLIILSYLPDVLERIDVNWPRLFKIIGNTHKDSLFIAIRYSKFLNDDYLPPFATSTFASRLIKEIKDYFEIACKGSIPEMLSAIDALLLFCRIYLYADMILYDSEIIDGFFSTVECAKWIGFLLTQIAVHLELHNSAIDATLISQVSRKIVLRLLRMNLIKQDEWVVKEYIDKTNHFPSVPHAIPFATRVESLREQTCIEVDPSFIVYNRPYLIRRTHIVEDSLQTLGNLSADKLRLPFRVVFVDEFGNPEDGVDGGGIFKEFLLILSKSIFDPSFGLFEASDAQDFSLYPSTTSGVAHENHLNMFEFVGSIVGKALFEGILIEPVLSPLLLNLILGHRNGFDELKYFDSQLHKNLLSLINLSDKELKALDLNFTTTINSLGIVNTHELITGGEQIYVNKSNVHEYILRLASFKCNTLIEHQSAAFLRGLSKIIPLEWLRNFSPSELQLLISGSPLIDVYDMRKNTVYSGYTKDSITVRYFWEILEQHDMDWRSEVLAFITSCRRAPLLGFAHLKPQLCITREPNPDRLPTSATCTNLLKLPDLKNKQLLLNKLDVVLKNCQGFLLD